MNLGRKISLMAAFAGVAALGVIAFGGAPAVATDGHPDNETLHRACTWTVDKATHHSTVTLSVDQQLPIDYTITVRATCTDSHHGADGSDPTNHHGGSHHAINGVIGGHSGSPDHIVNECVVLDDTFVGGPQRVEVCLADLVDGQKVFSYRRTLGPYTTCGDRTVSNTATLSDHHAALLASDTVNVIVRVPCTGCTLTQGYWKTHSKQGPAAKPDDAWNLVPLVYPGAPSGLAEDTRFYFSGRTWLGVFWTPPSGGNVYYQLAHQYMAAVLNRLNGASSTAAVDTALTFATSYFNNAANTPTSALLLGKTLRSTLQGYASTLGAYNEGKGGPPHCDEEHTH